MASPCIEQCQIEYGNPNMPFENAFWRSTHEVPEAELETAARYEEFRSADYDHEHEEPKMWRTECPLGHLADVLYDKPFDDEDLTYRYPDGDVVLSLAPRETDNLLLPRKLLEEKSPFFKAALSEQWLAASGRTKSAKPIRFELIYEEDGGSCLVQKPSATSWLQRLVSDNDMLKRVCNSDQKQFDDHILDCQILSCVGSWGSWWDGEPCDTWRRITINAYKLVIGLLLGIDIDYYQTPRMLTCSGDLRIWTVLVLKILEIADFLGCLGAVGEALVRLILSGPVPKKEIMRHCGLYLRIAVVLRSKQLFTTAYVYACNDGSLAGWFDQLAGDAQLESLVFRGRLELRVGVTRGLSDIAAVRYYYYYGGTNPYHSQLNFLADLAWQLWLREQGWSVDVINGGHLDSWQRDAHTYQKTVSSLVQKSVTAAEIMALFCQHHPATALLLEQLPSFRHHLQAELGCLIAEATRQAERILWKARPGFTPGDGQFNSVKEVHFPWIAPKPEVFGETKLTLLYETSVHPDGLLAYEEELDEQSDMYDVW